MENRIGLIRAFLPKKTDLNEISHETIAEIENKINNRPIRKFNYLSPKEKLVTYKAVALVTWTRHSLYYVVKIAMLDYMYWA